VGGWLISRPAGPVPDATGWAGQQGKEPNIQSFLGHKESVGEEGTEAHTHTREREREILRERRDGVIWVDRCVCLQCLSSSCIFATIFLRLIWFFWWGFVVVVVFVVFWLVFFCSGLAFVYARR
jgi:hypothetical protein